MINQHNTSYPRSPTDRQYVGLNAPRSPAHRQSAGLSYAHSHMNRQSAGLVHPGVTIDSLPTGSISDDLSSDVGQQPPLADSSSTGPPIFFHEGFFAGVTLRAELQELQKADVGRKYGRKDRRLLDPSPVVKLRLFQVLHPGTAEGEREIGASDIRNIGLVCFADLCSVPEDRYNDGSQLVQPLAPPSWTSAPLPDSVDDLTSGQPSPSALFPAFDLSPFVSTSQLAAVMPLPPSGHSPEFDPSLPQSFPSSWSIPAPTPLSHQIIFPSSPEPADLSCSAMSSTDPGVIGHTGDHPVLEQSRCTEGLVGSRSVSMCCVELQGKDTMLFIFSDLAVKIEGRFILHYRVFDIFSSASSSEHPHPALAECHGGPFQIYSTKKFPGLRASTDLTKHLSYLGARITSRQRDPESKRRRVTRDETPHPHRTDAVAIAPAPSAGQMETSMYMSSTLMMPEDHFHEYNQDSTM